MREAPAADKEVKLDKQANDGSATPYFSCSSASSVSSYLEVMVCHSIGNHAVSSSIWDMVPWSKISNVKR